MTQIQVTNTSGFTLYQGCRFGPVEAAKPWKPILRSVGTMCCFVSENVFGQICNVVDRCVALVPFPAMVAKKVIELSWWWLLLGRGLTWPVYHKSLSYYQPSNKAILRTNNGRSYHRFAVLDPHKTEELNLYHPSNWYMYWLNRLNFHDVKKYCLLHNYDVRTKKTGCTAHLSNDYFKIQLSLDRYTWKLRLALAISNFETTFLQAWDWSLLGS